MLVAKVKVAGAMNKQRKRDRSDRRRRRGGEEEEKKEEGEEETEGEEVLRLACKLDSSV